MPTQYATTSDFARLGLASGALARATTDVLDAHLSAASGYADGYLRARPYALPLTAWGDDLRDAVCSIAAESFATSQGWNPEDPANKAIIARADRAREWLRDVARGVVVIAVTDSTPTVDETSTYLTTQARRGWRRH